MNFEMKTAVSLLEELTVRLRVAAAYECVGQSGPPHSPVFEYRCRALGADVVAAARSKRVAKQEAARRALLALAATGALPAHVAAAAAALPAAPPPGAPAPTPPPKPASKTYVALLKELCEEYRLGAVEYPVVGDAGPAHARLFTMAARLGRHERRATQPTKKAARQVAAQALYQYLRGNLPHLTAEFVESDARPPLTQRVADYHRALPDAFAKLEPERRVTAREELEAVLARPERPEQREVAQGIALEALGLRGEWTTLEARGAGEAGGALHSLRAGSAWPAPVVLDGSRPSAAVRLARLLRTALDHDDHADKETDACKPTP